MNDWVNKKGNESEWIYPKWMSEWVGKEIKSTLELMDKWASQKMKVHE